MRFIIFFIFLRKALSSFCDFSQECSYCQNCWESVDDYCSCSFYNAFCYNFTKISYTYNSSFLFKYDKNNCIAQATVDNICGVDDISKEINDKTLYTFFSFNNPNYLNNNNLLCHYTIKNDVQNSKEDIVFEVEMNINKQNNKTIDNRKNLLIFFFQDYTSNTKTLYEINLNEFENKKYSLKFAEYKYISIYISLIQNNNYFMDNEIISMSLGVKKDTTKVANYKKYKYSLIVICIICIVCFGACFILYLIKYKRNRELIRMRALGMANNINEIDNRMSQEEKKTKLEKLFKEKLKKKKYLKKYNINESTACSICLEEFIENESLVCITPCLHIFHYDCLNNWLFTDNSNCQCPYCNYDLLSKKPPTQRHHILDDKNNITNKPNKKENKNNKKNNEENILENTSERVIKKVKKNKNNINENNNKNIVTNNNENKNNNNLMNNSENSNNINNINNSNINKNEKNKDIKNEDEDNDNDISFEKDYNKIKKTNNNNNKNNDTKNLNNNNDINNNTDKNEIENKNVFNDIKKESSNEDNNNENNINNSNE